MTPLAYIALLGWPLFVLALMATWPARRAATFALIGAWLLLPPYSMAISGLPDYTKSVAATLGLTIGTLLFAPDRLMGFRPRWADLPVVVLCLSGIPSALANGLTLYDGLSDALGQVLLWGLPYLMGRLYFTTFEDLRYFAVGMVLGGLYLVPPALWEVRMSPHLLATFYGQAGWEGMRLGGYRPHLFFSTGLECGMWMTAAALSGWWLWYRGSLSRLGSYAFGPLLAILLVTTVLCRSTGALVLLLAGLAILWLSIRFRTRLLMAALLAVGPAYVGIRLPDLWSGQQAVDLATAIVGPVRAESLEYRFKCERLLGDRALQQPIFGWGGYGRNLVYSNNDLTKPIPPDGLWIGTVGGRGFVGLVSLYLVLALPAALFIRRLPTHLLGDPRMAAAMLATVLMGLYIADCLMNAFVNILYITMTGALAGVDPRKLGSAGVPAEAGSAHRRAGERTAKSAAAARGGDRAQLADRCRGLGRSLKRDGRFDEADRAWLQALDLLGALIESAPGDRGVRRRWCDCANDLAWLRANRPDPARREPDSAVELARRAADEFPDIAAYWNTLGAACYRAGDPRGAIAALERSAAIGGGSAFDDVFLAMARARAGDPSGARQALALAMIEAERDHPGHPELAALCDEAHALIDGGATAPTTVG